MPLISMGFTLSLLICQIIGASAVENQAKWISEEITMPHGSTEIFYIRENDLSTSTDRINKDLLEETKRSSRTKIVFLNGEGENLCDLQSRMKAVSFAGAEVSHCDVLAQQLMDRSGKWKGWDWDGGHYSIASFADCEFGISRRDGEPGSAFIGNLDVAVNIKSAIDPAHGLVEGGKVAAEGNFDCFGSGAPKIFWTLGATNWPTPGQV
ncbi:hypothetical protein JX265_000038 [Neoarthrinium moseri]|uniref:Ecp2 effector protein-like domain-containing protein n=1 Tax=Neoarthrinium moseri TaxID=1658444 RepID=A0A9P9WXT3_9PEZI|nr:uncharacterized protein JN550_001260 [Neoarthrinium moseri]KAI1845783.1 hypothetical protein JX266_008148 [Neoarthrinium moseri]KAI1877188.1 hypothetical protein JN550_001260 [Neoarthrinium moseri]KAI1881212.1 hypothetical protein JX265_000038 [Neoarthrinium moseri]